MIGVETEVLVVGAGPTGLVLAGELARRGISVRIVDRASEASPHSRALAIQARILEIFEFMGIADKFLQQGWQMGAFNVFDRKNHIVRMTFAELESKYNFVLSLPQSVTDQILAGHLLKYGGIIERSTSLIGLEQNADHVTATLQRGDGSDEFVKCKWLVGCDGAHSDVRHLLKMPFAGHKYPETYVLADIEVETPLDLREFYIFSAGTHIAGLHAFSGKGEARMFADITGLIPAELASEAEALKYSVGANTADMEQDSEYERDTRQDIQAMFDERGPGNVKVLKVNWTSIHAVHRRQVESYRNGRVFLAGDAAHVHSPASGQGMNLGIQDAFNLAWKLTLASRNHASASVLESYSSERLAAGREILAMTDFFTRINTAKNPIAQKIRNTVGPLLSEFEPIRESYRNAVTQLATSYRHSPIVFDDSEQHFFEGTHRIHAGDRTPDFALTDKVSAQPMTFFSLMPQDGRHLLVLLTGTTANQSVVDRLCNFVAESNEYSDLIEPVIIFGDFQDWKGLDCSVRALHDDGMAMHSAYHVFEPSLLVVRPDGHLGYRGNPDKPELLRRYLSRSFNRF